MKKHLRFLSIIFMWTFGFSTANAQEAIDTISFEIPETEIVLDTSGSNLWQIGKPQKIYFDTAHSGMNAILTDTINHYPPNDTSSFIYIIRNPFTQTCLTCMEFWHKYDMDSLADKGIIDASYDGGNSWVVVKDTFVNTLSTNFMWSPDYHMSTGNFTNHPLVTSGKSDGWIKSGFCWQWYFAVSPDTIIANPDSLLLRFTFISDSILESREGWMIDDIVTTAGSLELCSGVNEPYHNERITVYPNPFSTQAFVQTEKSLHQATLTVCNSLGQKVKQMKNLSGQSFILERDNLPVGLYFLQLTQENKFLNTTRIFITDH